MILSQQEEQLVTFKISGCLGNFASKINVLKGLLVTKVDL